MGSRRVGYPPTPPFPVSTLINSKNIFFLWNVKKDKIKRSVIINEYEEGGLKCHIFKLLTKPLKCHKLLDPFNHSPRKIILLG
jgi:hypothetical protein